MAEVVDTELVVCVEVVVCIELVVVDDDVVEVVMTNFGRYVVTRIFLAIPVFFGVSIISFVIQKITPGDPVITALGVSPNITPAQLAAARAELGLNAPVYVQYLKYLDRIFHGNFGNSIFFNLPVATLISQALPNTLVLILAAHGNQTKVENASKN